MNSISLPLTCQHQMTSIGGTDAKICPLKRAFIDDERDDIDNTGQNK